MGTTVSITYEAKCKHCNFYTSLGRGTGRGSRCTVNLSGERTYEKIFSSPVIGMNDKACSKFQL